MSHSTSSTYMRWKRHTSGGGVDDFMLQTQEDSIQSHTRSVSNPEHAHGYDDKFPNYNFKAQAHLFYDPTKADKINVRSRHDKHL